MLPFKGKEDLLRTSTDRLLTLNGKRPVAKTNHMLPFKKGKTRHKISITCHTVKSDASLREKQTGKKTTTKKPKGEAAVNMAHM